MAKDKDKKFEEIELGEIPKPLAPQPEAKKPTWTQQPTNTLEASPPSKENVEALKKFFEQLKEEKYKVEEGNNPKRTTIKCPNGDQIHWEGNQVTLKGNDPKTINKMMGMLSAGGVTAIDLKGVNDPKMRENIYEEAKKCKPPINVLMNNQPYEPTPAPATAPNPHSPK